MTAVAQETRILVVEAFPPEAKIRAFFPKSPGAGDGLPNGDEVSVPSDVLKLPVRISAEGFETRDEEIMLVSDTALKPNYWRYETSLRPESPTAFLRSQWHHHPARSGLVIFSLVLLSGASFVGVRRRIQKADEKADALKNAADLEVSKLKQKLVEGSYELEGEMIDDYQTLETLGEGAYSRVYLVRHRDFEDLFALKLLKQESHDPEMLARTHREVQVGLELKHPNIVKVFACGTYRGSPYIVSEFVPGRPLDEVLDGERLSIGRTCRLLEQLVLGLEHAHDKGVIHRDIKPGNLFLGPDDTLKILDFGLARVVEADKKLTKTGQALGTPIYMSPEQIRGNSTAASDYYSAGILFFELLAGRVPFDGDNAMQILSAHAFKKPPSVREFNPDVPEELADMVAALLIKKPEHRLADPDHIVQTLAIYKNLDHVESQGPSEPLE